MAVAQGLYMGVDIQKETVALITYMRTDSISLSKESDALRAATPILDGMVTKGIYKKNKCARIKSRLNARIKAIAS